MNNQPTEMAGDSGGRVSCRYVSPVASVQAPCHPHQATVDDVESPSPCRMRDAVSALRPAPRGVRFMTAVTVVLLTVVTAEAAAPAAPTSVAVYSTEAEELEVSWSSSDFAATIGYKVQWKSGTEDYAALRQASADPATSLVASSSSTTTRRYEHAISGLTDGTEYTVQVIATNSEGDSSVDGPQVEVSLGQGSTTVHEGGTSTVQVRLNTDPERTVVIPLEITLQDATTADYAGVPSSVTFSPGETVKEITATDDDIDDDDETVELGFGELPPGVSEGSPNTATVTIADNDDPAVTVSFDSATYAVTEGWTVDVVVTLNANPERTVTIPVEASPDASGDYSIPGSVTFDAGETQKSVNFVTVDDSTVESAETFTVSFGSTLPTGVSLGSQTTTSVTIADDDAPETGGLELSALAVTGGVGSMYPVFNPRVHHYAIRCPDATTLHVTATARDASHQLTLNNIPVAGMELDKNVVVDSDDDVAIELSDGDESVLYVVHCIPTDFPNIKITKKQAGVSDGLMFLTPARNVFPRNPAFMVIMDNNGVPRFVRHSPGVNPLNFRRHTTDLKIDGRPVHYSVTHRLGSSFNGRHYLLDASFNVIGTVETALPEHSASLHDFLITKDNTFLFFSHGTVTRDVGGNETSTVENVIEEVSPTGDALWSWKSWDHLTIDPDCLGYTFGLRSDPNITAHINALTLIDGDVVASSRGCAQVVRINRSGNSETDDGTDIVWQLGGTDQDADDRAFLAISGDESGRNEFCRQHHATETASGTVVLFDNGVNCLSGEIGELTDPKRGDLPTFSRAVEYAIDPDTGTAEFHREVRLDRRYGYAPFTGSVDILENGHWLINWGYLRDADPSLSVEEYSIAISEVDASGTELLQVKTWEWEGTSRYSTFRAYRESEADVEIPLNLPPPPTVTLALTPPSISENNGSSTVTASLDRASSVETTVTVTAEAMSPAVSGDFTLSSNGTLGITAGQTSSTGVVTVGAVDNNVDAPDKTVAVTATAENTNGVTQPSPVLLTITDDDSTPVITTTSPILVAENRTAVATLAATDADRPAEDLRWAIAGGADRDEFLLAADGELAFKAAKDYEEPDDANRDREYEVTVRVSDGANPVEAPLTVRLLDVDDTAPTLSSASVNGAALRLTYNEPLGGSSTPEAGDFTVTGGDRAHTVTRVSVSGSTVVLTLDTAAEHLEAGILVSYTPGTNKIRDVPGNQAEGLSQVRVTNETPDTTPPEVESLAVSSNPGADQTYAAGDEIEVTVTFNETVEVEGAPQLRLRVGSRTRMAGYLSGTGTAALVFGYEVADGDEDTDGVSIEAGRIALNRGMIEDEAENAAELDHEALATQAGHKVDGVRPSFLSAAADGASLTLTYGEALDGGSRPAPGDFTVEVGGSGRSVTGVSISGSVVTLTLNPAVEHGDTGIRVSYTPGTNPIRDAVGNDARGLSSRSLTNTTGAPNTAPEITSPSSFDVPENQMVARRLAARDTDAGDEVTGWEIVGGADQSEFSIASDTGELSFRDPPDFEAPGDNEYLVTVEVRSGAGARELEAEQTFTIRVTDEREPPDVPEVPTFSGETADSLTVRWSEPDNTGPAITDYDVQYREKGTGRFIDGDQQGPGRTLTLEDLEPGTVYEVQVRAKNDEGTSDWSDPGEGMTVAPLTVGMTSGTDPPVSGPFTVRFSFSEPVTGFSASDIETGQDPACVDDQNNTVFCDPGIGGLQTADNRVFTTTVTPWTNRVAHSYTLTLTVPGGAVRSSVGSKPNEEPEEPLEVRVAPPGVTEPISSIGLGASPGSGSVRLSWNRPSDNGGSAIIRYEVRYQAVGEAWSEWEKVGAGARGVTVGNLINGREYVFEVRAVNALGKGGAETVQATPERRIAPPPPRGGGGGGGGGGGLLFPPEAPAGLMAMPGEGAVRLEWGPPESDGGTPILRYEYRLKEGRGAFGEWTRIEDSAPGEVNASGYTVGELGKGTVYVFELRAVNLVGKGRVSEAVEAVMGLDPAYWSNFGAEDLQGVEASLERGPFGGGPQSLRLRFGADLRFEESELDGDGEVTETRSGSYGYRYTSRTTGELRLDYDGGESCELRVTFRGVGVGSYSYHRCGGVLGGQGSFRLSGLNRAPEITGAGAYEVAENTARVGRIEAVDGDDEIGGYGIAGGADGALFAVEAGELMFREAPDYEDPSDVESAEPASGAGDNEYIVVVEVRSGEGERERRGSRAIRVRVADEEEPPEITSVGPFEVVENRTRVGQLEAVDQDKPDEITEYGIAGGADGGLFAVVEETGELMFREAPDYEDPSDVESAEPASGAADNEYIVVVEVRSGEGERERRGSRAIRVRVSDEEEPPEITSLGPFEVVENRTRVGQLEAVDQDKQDEITEYGIAGGADGGLFEVEAKTGELMFREAPDYEIPGDVESAEPASRAADNEYIVVVEVRSGEGERERRGSRAIRVRVADEEEPPGAPGAPVVTAEGSDSLKVSWREPENRGPEIVDYEVRYREGGEAGYSDGGHEGTGLEVRLSGLEEGTVYEVQVRAVNEEGMSEWSEPGEGRTDTEEADPEDPSDFTEGDLEGERLTLRLEGEEGTARSLELRFGEGNRFEQIESVGEQVATRTEGAASRSGSYSYQRTGSRMGTLSLAYDDGSSCEVLLAFTESGAGTFSYDCGGGDPAEGSFRLTTGSLFVPVILSAAGRSNSLFTSELTLTNRGDEEVKLDYTYTAHRGGGSGKTSDVLAPGMQKIETDALTYLRGLGIPIPETGNRIGTLRVEARLGSEVEAVVRTTTLVPEGRAGLAYLGVAEEEGFDEAVYLCGLRQNGKDRSNVAFQNMGAEEEGAITVRTTVYSGEAADATARVLEDIELEPGEFHQYSGLLGVLGVPAQGYVKVERVEGRAPFYAYGVINDQANSDGSFIFPVAASSLEGTAGQTLPVIVETSEFRSELTVTNFSEEPRRLDFQFVAERIEADDKTAAFSMRLEAGRQEIIAEVVDELRRRGVAGLGTTRGFYAGPLFAEAEGGDMSGIVIGARTGSEGGGGQYSVFYNAVPFGEAFSRVAWVDGLQQNEENRSNLALINTGEVDDSESVFHLEIYDGETGLLAETVVTKPIPARRWHQINGILGSYAPETRQGYIRIEKVSGENPFLAYGVVNDGGAPGERSGDGAYLPARE